MEIKSHPVYKQMAGRFLGGLTKDRALEEHGMGSSSDVAKSRNNEIGEEKEREGMYPNELDQEMKGYKYGDRI